MLYNPAEVHWHQLHPLILTLGSGMPHTRGYRAADLPERQACKDAGRPGRGPLAPAAPAHSHTWAAARRTIEATGQQINLSGQPAGVLDHPAEVHWHQLHPLILTLGSSMPHTRGHRAADLPEQRACKGAVQLGRGPLTPAAPTHSNTWQQHAAH